MRKECPFPNRRHHEDEMSDDIVERIRNRLNDAPMPTERLLDEAADEIERLRAARASAFEEAAKIAESDELWKGCDPFFDNREAIAAAIREHARK